MDQNVYSKMNGPPMCGKCNKHIFDGTILQAQGQFWHNDCIQCVSCRKLLNGCCHFKDNNFYCRDDFLRTFGTKCSGCTEIISPTECINVANEHVYHTTCFTCSICSSLLHPGNYFYLREDARLVCASDYKVLLELEKDESESESDESGSDDTDPHHSTRSIHNNQLRVLLGAYDNNRRPGRNARQQLSQMTGLKTRTIQMWFQNKRSKEKQLQRKETFVNGGQSQIKQKNNDTELRQNVNLCGNFTGQFAEENDRYVPQTETTSCPQTENIMHQTGSSNEPYAEMNFDNYELYCPLDYLLPNEMPPNVDLSSADICNGEVIAGKQNAGSNRYHLTHPGMLYSNGSRPWVAI